MATRQYIGPRYVIKVYENSSDPSSAEWEALTNYEPLTLVTFNMGSYLSKKNVPATVGNPVDNPNYWVQTGYYNGQIATLEEHIVELQTALNREVSRSTSKDNILDSAIEGVASDLVTERNNRMTDYANVTSSIGNVSNRLNSEITTRESADANLQSQIDEIVAPSGEAPSAAEVENARIGADNVTYNTLGNAIRTQFDKTWEDGVDVGVTVTTINGGYINNTNGNLIEHEGWKYTDYIDISSANGYIVPSNSVTQTENRIYNAFYNAAHTFISSFTATGEAITVPSNAKYIRMSTPTGATLALTIGVCDSLGKLTKDIREVVSNTNKTNASASYKAKYGLTLKAGGLNVNTGVETGSQYTRLHSDAFYTSDEMIIITTKQLRSDSQYVKIFYWNNEPNSSTPCDSTTDWIACSVSTPIAITKNKWVKILFDADGVTENITNPYDNYYFNSFELVKSSLITVDELNKEMLTAVQACKSTYPPNAQSEFAPVYAPLSFLHFSDIHGDPELWRRCGKFLDAHMDELQFSIMTGDYCGDNLTQYNDLYNSYTAFRPILNCVGNHDTYANAQHATATKEAVYNKLFNHTELWDVIFAPLSYSMTYYKDFASQKIRLIVLDNYYDIEEQLTWLATTMNDAKALGYSVITASHQVTSSPDTKIDCTFQTLIPYEEGTSPSVVPTQFDAVIGNFIANGGKHIVHLSGHEHQNWFYRTATGVLNLCVENAGTYAGWTEGTRKKYTKSWDCFNVLGIDINFGIIKVVRIGANIDSYGRTLNTLVYDYVHDTVIQNT